VSVKQDATLLVQELERRERDAGERPPVGERGIGPGLGPIGTDEHHRTLGDPAVLAFHLQRIVPSKIPAELTEAAEDDPARLGPA
jgi:hypothetical protein